MILVGEEREGEAVLLPELRVLLRVVRADAKDDGAALLELAPGIADAAGLSGATRSVVLG